MATIFTEATVDPETQEMFVNCVDAETGISMKVVVPMDALDDDTNKSVVRLARNMPEAFLRGVMMIAEEPNG